MTTAKNKKQPEKPKTAAKTTGAATKPKQPRKIPWVGIVFGVVAVALIAAITFSSDEAIGSEFGEVEITGESLPVFAGAAADAAVGLSAPEVTGVDFSDNAVAITNDGTPKAVVFLAHWCPHCQAEVPRVQAWLDAGGGVEGVELMSVATSMNSAQANYPSSDWLEREGWTVPVIRDTSSNDALVAYGGSAFPYYVFIDASGNVVRRASGELDIATLESYMQEIAPTT